MLRLGLIGCWVASVVALPDSGSSLFARAACNRDNCFRQVAASATPGGPARGSAGCSSVLATTVTPCPVTSTITDTATSTVTVATTTVAANVEVEKRALEARVSACVPTTQSSSSIPTYASSCRNLAQYSSACSCNGVPGSVTTLAPVTSTVTVTTTTVSSVTATVTATSPGVCCGCPVPFALQVSGSSVNGQYLEFEYSAEIQDNVLTFTPTLTSASLFTLDTQCRLVTNGYHSVVGPNDFYDIVREELATDTTDPPLICTPANGALTCVDNSGFGNINSEFSYSSLGLAIESPGNGNGPVVTLNIVVPP